MTLTATQKEKLWMIFHIIKICVIMGVIGFFVSHEAGVITALILGLVWLDRLLAVFIKEYYKRNI